MDFQNPVVDLQLRSNVENAYAEIHKTADSIESVIKGKREVIEMVLIALAANGHVLLKDVPGVGKTLLAKALAKSIATVFRRIQFTPDLLPSDVTGVSIFNPKTREFEFQAGPVFTNILLADEINRTSPKTQSALLEAMEERQVSVDNKQYKLPGLFMVIATQNPIEHSGTYPLPTAQLDRFMMQVSIGYPDKAVEMEILQLQTQNINPLDQIQPVTTDAEVLKWQTVANTIYTAPAIDNYLVDLARATRDGNTGYGVSTRATVMLKRAARACALINRRDFVIPDDIHKVIRSVFAHRIGGRGVVGDAVVDELMQKVVI